MEKEICRKVAEIYAGKDWHKLSSKEHELVKLLEEGGHIIPNKPVNGFVGKAAHIVGRKLKNETLPFGCGSFFMNPA